MDRYIVGENRSQIAMFAMSFDEMIEAENPVRAINAIVDKMDIKSLGFKYSTPKETGRKAYNPVDMFKLYTYCYFNGIRSSRKIERECKRNIEVMWLLEKLTPDFKTIADFRKDNKEGIKKAFSMFSLICGQLGLIGKEIVAIDGSKFKASNSQDRYYTKKKVQAKLTHFEKKATQYIALLDYTDKNEEGNPPPQFDRKDLTKKLEYMSEKILELKDMEKEIEANGDIALTDPDSKMMKVKNNGREICHNVQVAVDATHKLVVAVDVTSEAGDREQLHNMALQAKEELGVDTLTALADKGYYASKQFKRCSDDKIKVLVARPVTKNGASESYPKDKFSYVKEKNVYVCPQGAELTQREKRANAKLVGEVYANPSACKNCPVREKCTKNKYRSIKEVQYQRYADKVDEATKENADLLKDRKGLIEHLFGVAKRASGFNYFLTCGHENVLAEIRLYFISYNLKRMINILGTRKIVASV